MITYENTESETYEQLFMYQSQKYENPNVTKKLLQHEIHSPTLRSKTVNDVINRTRNV